MIPPRNPNERKERLKIEAMLAEEADIELPMDPAFYDRLHDKIMAGVEETEIRPRRPWIERPYSLLQKHWRSWLTGGASLMSLLLTAHLASFQAGFLLDDTHTVVAARQEDRLLVEVLNNPDAFSRTLLGSNSEEDFFIDVASQSFENLTNDKFNEMMGGRSSL